MPISNTPGAKLAIKNPSRNHGISTAPPITYRIYEVKRETATQVVAGNMHDAAQEIRVRKADGVIVDGGQCRNYAIDATPEILARHDAEAIAYRRWTAARRRMEPVERALDGRKLTTEQMEAIATAYEATLSAAPGAAA